MPAALANKKFTQAKEARERDGKGSKNYSTRGYHKGWGRGGGGNSTDLIDLRMPTGSARNTPRFGGVAAKCPERLTFNEKI